MVIWAEQNQNQNQSPSAERVVQDLPSIVASSRRRGIRTSFFLLCFSLFTLESARYLTSHCQLQLCFLKMHIWKGEKNWKIITGKRVTQSWGENSYVGFWLLMTIRLVYNLYQRIGCWKVSRTIFGVKCIYVSVLVFCSKSMGCRWSPGSFALFYNNHMYLLI